MAGQHIEWRALDEGLDYINVFNSESTCDCGSRVEDLMRTHRDINAFSQYLRREDGVPFDKA